MATSPEKRASTPYDVVVLGGGQAGLVAGYYLQHAALSFVILDEHEQVGGSWQDYYDSLTLFSPARYSVLPGLSFGGDLERYPTRIEAVEYLRRYAEHFKLPVRGSTAVTSVQKEGDVFVVYTSQGVYTSRAVIVATGPFRIPKMPDIPSMKEYKGQSMHSMEYQNPKSLVGKKVLIIGSGASAVQIATECARVAEVTLTHRTPIHFVPQRLFGKPIQFWQQFFVDWLPLRLKRTVVVDMGMYQKALESGAVRTRPMYERCTPQGVVWQDGTEEAYDAIICATGFTYNTKFLDIPDALKENGEPRMKQGVSAADPALCFLGFDGERTVSSATLRGVGRDARAIVRHLKNILHQ